MEDRKEQEGRDEQRCEEQHPQRSALPQHAKHHAIEKGEPQQEDAGRGTA